MNNLQAGFARTNINPMMGLAISGYFIPRHAEAILDDLEINAVAVKCGDECAVMLSADILYIETYIANECKKKIAEKLGIPQLCYVEEVKSVADGKVTVRRAIEGGYEILESPMPALMTVIDANLPRPMNAHRIMKYKRARVASELAKEVGAENLEAVKAELEARGLLITELNAAQINADPARIGFPGSPTKVKQVMSVVLTAGEAKTVEPTADGIAELIHELISDHTLG